MMDVKYEASATAVRTRTLAFSRQFHGKPRLQDVVQRVGHKVGRLGSSVAVADNVHGALSRNHEKFKEATICAPVQISLAQERPGAGSP